MCFTNNRKNLDKMRSRKKPIHVWKIVKICPGTGEAYSQYGFFPYRKVTWEQGKIVKPNRKRKPLGEGGTCSAGLYFYIGKLHANNKGRPGYVEATVKPEDIIAVDYENHNICVIAATVINDPNPEHLEVKKEQLKTRVEQAKEKLKQRVEIVKEWYEGGREEWEEAYQQIKDQLKSVEEEIKARPSQDAPRRTAKDEVQQVCW